MYVHPFFSILNIAAYQMLEDLKLGNNEEGNVTESELFEADGRLTEAGERYLEEAMDDELEHSAIRCWLASVLNKECFTFFKIERAAEKRTGSIL